jgi:SAM-dependent methyltransferase
MGSERDAAYFDGWYADMAVSPVRDAVFARTLGLPAHLESTSHLTWQGIADVVDELRLVPDGVLVDLACGRGGYGIEVAQRTGARLVGVDFSAVAVERAAANSAHALPAGRSEFVVGTLTATGLPAGAADAVMCVDAVQFASPPLAALVECRRLLRPGGRVVLTTWEAVGPADERVPPRVRAVHLERDLRAAGLVEVEVRDRADWREHERHMWQEAVAVPDSGDPAVLSLKAEGRRSLETFDSLRRVVATATAP